MTVFVRAVRAELTKLNRSLVWLLAAAPPGMMGIMILGMGLSGNGAEDWAQLIMSGTAIWAYLLMPLTLTALTALIAGVEHNCGGWTWSLAQPVPKTVVFLAKAVISALLMGLIGAGIGIAVLLAGLILSVVHPDAAMTGELDAGLMASLIGRMWAASLLVVAIQFTVSHAFRAFAVPIVVGIGGTFASVVATSWKYGIYFPWLLPVNMLASDPARAQQALLTGLLGGITIFVLASLWLARRDWR